MSINGEDRRYPPMDTKVTAADVDGTATAAAAIANMPASPGTYYTWENCGTTDITIVFGRDNTMAAPTLTTNGGLLKAGEARDWYFSPAVTHWRAIGSAAGGKLRYWPS